MAWKIQIKDQLNGARRQITSSKNNIKVGGNPHHHDVTLDGTDSPECLLIIGHLSGRPYVNVLNKNVPAQLRLGSRWLAITKIKNIPNPFWLLVGNRFLIITEYKENIELNNRNTSPESERCILGGAQERPDNSASKNLQSSGSHFDDWLEGKNPLADAFLEDVSCRVHPNHPEADEQKSSLAIDKSRSDLPTQHLGWEGLNQYEDIISAKNVQSSSELPTQHIEPISIGDSGHDLPTENLGLLRGNADLSDLNTEHVPHRGNKKMSSLEQVPQKDVPASFAAELPDQKAHSNLLPVGSELAEFIVKSVLGKGNFGVTYLAWDNKLERNVAIKEFLPNFSGIIRKGSRIVALSEESEGQLRWGLDRFVREARMLANLFHPHLVQVYSFFEENGTAYLVMSYEQGKSLSAHIMPAKTLPESLILKIIRPLLSALRVVHQAGLIHRDIKPANIFIRDKGGPVLLDFGAARQAISARTQVLTSFFSPGYAPFEQYSTDSRQQGPWTDIYSLGAVCYRMMIGKPPKDAQARIMARIAEQDDPLPAISQILAKKYSPQFLNAVERAMVMEIDRRPQTISEWEKQLPGVCLPRQL